MPIHDAIIVSILGGAGVAAALYLVIFSVQLYLDHKHTREDRLFWSHQRWPRGD